MVVVWNYHSWICGGNSGRSTAFDASCGFAGRKCNAIYRNTVYCNISRLCDRTGGQRYRKLLVRLWTERDFAAHSDRWSWCGYDRCFDCDAFREKNFPDAAKHDAGCDFCPEGGRNCAPDAFYPQRNLWNWTVGGVVSSACFFTGLRRKRNLDGVVSFCIRILQCRIWSSRKNGSSVSVPDFLCGKSTG